ncbi:MAG: bifunctional adenosylcobinamide kinase/adenosylcobinamide-phosphate guanylyltransferase [Chloroflexi bacterium]|nr:bifunctional adenosylcobinamide kinase/adenosylcobinamide-phosphate guanylyltransferase [Chloroflexota bacterium]
MVAVLGGARSGKSRYALQRASDAGDRVTYLATARRGDAELDERIARHVSERPAAWRTREVTSDLREAIAEEDADRTLLVDSLGLWVATLLEGSSELDAAWRGVEEALRGRGAPVIVVSEDAGSGLVPESPLGRRFRDELGFMNQRLVAAADEAVLMVAGVPLKLR